ncbi:MAG: PTS glucose transporter subunit IIA [Epsilonproteobacteria bacterium]|nr:PTS glucose transporter subunit IIA [Campylobacterota bacterium]
MFGLFKAKSTKLVSPVDGQLIELENVPDKVFSQKLVGDGIAVIPSSGTVVAPVTGVISRIFPTHHAFSITTSNGLEVMVHIGLDTVELQGEGFSCLKKEGDEVTVGTPIIRVDKEYLKSQGKEIITPMVVSSEKEITVEKHKVGIVREGEVLLEVKFS